MRQVIFILVLSSILMPIAALQQGLVSDRSMSGFELRHSFQAAIARASNYYRRAQNWLESEFR